MSPPFHGQENLRLRVPVTSLEKLGVLWSPDEVPARCIIVGTQSALNKCSLLLSLLLAGLRRAIFTARVTESSDSIAAEARDQIWWWFSGTEGSFL